MFLVFVQADYMRPSPGNITTKGIASITLTLSNFASALSHYDKRCLTSTFCFSVFLKLLKNIFSNHKQKMFVKHCDDQTEKHCA